MRDEPRSTAITIVESIRCMCEPHAGKITAAFIFGSVVRGTDTAQSDIDLMIVGELDYDTVYAGTDQAGQLLGLEVSPVVLSTKDWRHEAAMPQSFISKVRASPKLFVFGADSDL